MDYSDFDAVAVPPGSGPILRIALPAWRISPAKQNVKMNEMPSVTKDEMQSLFGCELRSRRSSSSGLTTNELEQIQINRHIRAALKGRTGLISNNIRMAS